MTSSIERSLICLAVLCLLLVGCNDRSTELPPKMPRPVTSIELIESSSASTFVVPGSVKSWKTERIGFEVGGRVQWVLEPGTNIKGRILDEAGQEIAKGIKLAQIDPARYQVALDSANAALEVAKLEENIQLIRFEDAIPAEIESAKADLELAESEFSRLKSLRDSNAVSQADFDDADNRRKTQIARVANLESSLHQAQVELTAAKARVKSANQALNDAQRDYDNTTLYASYNGQISEVHVVNGSVVDVGSPVLTLQMMHPIKIEIEVSADQSRAIQRKRQVPVMFSMPDGRQITENAFLYVIDPSADPTTRTFTVTLLLLNEQFRPDLPDRLRDVPAARVENLWPLHLNDIVGAPADSLFIEETSIARDADGAFVWQVTNAQVGDTMPDILKVVKRPINVLDRRIRFIGEWIFQEFEFADADSSAAPPLNQTTLICGELAFHDIEPSQWDSESVIVDQGEKWMLRPGDLVSVYLNNEPMRTGYFVPVQAIYEEFGNSYIFVVDGEVARKTQVTAIRPTELNSGAQFEIRPLQGETFAAGTQIVLGGVHFLKDGDQVNVVEVVDPTNYQSAPWAPVQIGDDSNGDLP